MGDISITLILVLVMATTVIALLWARPKLMVASTLFIALFVRSLTHLTGLSILENLDDFFVCLCVLRALFESLVVRRSGVRYPGMLAFASYALAGTASAVFADVDVVMTMLPGAFLALKGVLLGWAVAQFGWNTRDVRVLIKTGAWTIGFVLLASTINILIPAKWAAVISVSGGSIDRYGLPSLFGPFIHPFDLAFTLSMGGVAILAYRRFFARGPLSFLALVGTYLGTVLTFRRKDLLGLFTATGLFALRSRYYWLLTFAAPVLVGAVIMGWQTIYAEASGLVKAYFTQDSAEARTVLSLGSLTVALNHFPFGAGFGRYGSRIAGVQYSPEYYHLGFPTVYGLEPGGSFLTDTSWPAVLGETGFFGALFFIVGLAFVARSANSWRAGRTPELRWLGATTSAWVILTLFQSTGSAVFTSPPMFAFLFTLIGIGASLSASDSGQFNLEHHANELKETIDDRP